MTTVSHSRQIAGDPAAIWTVLADFGNLSGWATGVDHSCLLNSRVGGPGIGLVRRVQSGRDTFTETITAFDPPRVLAYDIGGVPRGFTASNRWRLEPQHGDHTTVTLTSTATSTARVLRSVGERVLAHVVARRSGDLLDSLTHALREHS